jgi:hypothetical protein
MRQLQGCAAIWVAMTAMLGFGLLPQSAHAAFVEPLPVASTTPANGATVAPHGALLFEYISPVNGTIPSVSVQTQNVTEPNGKLASSGGGDIFGAAEISPEHYGATSDSSWAPHAGTYYWQIQAFCYINCSEAHLYLSPVYTLAFAAPAPTEPAGRPRPVTTSSPRPISTCHRGSTRARIGGKVKCLHGGEVCARRYRHQYLRHHYACIRKGRAYRLVRL